MLYDLRQHGLSCDMNFSQKAFKGQLKQALRNNAQYLVIIGEDEYQRGVVSIKDTKTETQEEVIIQKVEKYLVERLVK